MADVFTLQGSVDVSISKAIADVKRLGNEADTASNKFQKMGQKLSNAGKKMSDFGGTLTKGLTLPIAGAATASFKFASDMEESLNKVKVACGSGADEVIKFSETTLKSFGIAKGTALDMVSTFADMGGGMGLTTEEANKMGTSLVGLAGDLASFKNVRVDVAQTALNGIYTGETESLKQLGIVMTEANLQEFALSQGMKKKVKDMTQAEKVQLRYNYVMAKTTNAQGDFARTSDGSANQLRIFQESLKELAATLGQHLLPLITPVITKINDLVQRFGKLDEKTQKIILVVGGVVAAIGPLMMIGGKLIGLCGAISTGFGAITTATGLATAPILGIIGGIGLLVAGFVELWNTNEEFKYSIINGLEAIKNAIIPCFQVVKDNSEQIFQAIQVIWDTFVNILNDLWYAVLQPVWDLFVLAIQVLSEIFQEVFPILVGIFTDFSNIIKKLYDDILSPLIGWIGQKVQDLMPVFQFAFGFIGSVVSDCFKGIASFWNNSLKPILTGIIDFVSGVFTGDWSKVWDGVVSIFGGIMNGLGAVIKAPLNAVIGLINGAIGGLNKISVDIPDWIPGVGGKKFGVNIPKMNYLENGGILTKPTMLNPFIMAGEKNKGQESQSEVVIPLDKLINQFEAVASRPIILKVDGREIMRALAPHQKEFTNYNNLRFV